MEEYTTETEHKKPKKMQHSYVKPVAITLGAALVVVLSFTAGTQFEKHHNRAGLARGAFSRAALPEGSRRRFGGLGIVTTISNTSITVKNTRTNASSTYAITSSTQILNDGSNATISDIKTGDTVMVRASNTDTNTAAEIEINPSFGGASSDDLPDVSGNTVVN